MFNKRLLAVLLAGAFLFCNAIIVHAQVIYLFLDGAIQDPQIGRAVSHDLRNILLFLGESTPKNQLVIYNFGNSWKGPDVNSTSDTKNAILTAIQNCPAKSTDTIVFYWSGHGAYDKSGHYIFLPKGGKDRIMYRSEILSALQKKGASLTVLITDSCNVFHDYSGHGAVVGAPLPEIDHATPLISSLFLNCKGVVNINSSSPGEKSYCSSLAGSVFTINLYNSKFFNENKSMTWSSFLDDVQERMKEDGSNQKIDISGRLPSSTLSRESNNIRPKNVFSNQSEHKNKYSLGKGYDDEPSLPKGQWSDPKYYPENGDRIISVNDIPIRDEAHFRQVIKNADTQVMLTLIEHRKGKPYKMITNLNPPGSITRLGIYIQSDSRGGVRVTGVVPGTPGTRCRYLIDDDNNY